jgi:threonine dehydrogenase-like Zn-dependent dehydrogenase
LGAKPVEGGDYDVVFECAGSESAIDQSVALLRPGGKLVLMSVSFDRISLPGMELLFKEIQVIPSMSYSTHTGGRDIDSAAALLALNPHIAQTIITHRFPLEDASEAFRVAKDRSAGAIKVVLEP